MSAEINRLAYEQYAVQARVNQSPVCDDTRPEYDAANCDAMQFAVVEQLREIEVMQRELQAIAAHIAQPGTPSVIGPGAVNIVVDDAGVPTFITTPSVPSVVTPSPSVVVNDDDGTLPRTIVVGEGDGGEDGGDGAAGAPAGSGAPVGLGILAGAAVLLLLLARRPKR
ncbi:MAG: hypothetical protein ACREJC_22780 [Tepidisphaeraceae bacterium]